MTAGGDFRDQLEESREIDLDMLGHRTGRPNYCACMLGGNSRYVTNQVKMPHRPQSGSPVVLS